MAKAFAKTIIIMCSMFFGGILVCGAFLKAHPSGLVVCLLLSVGAVFGLIISILLIEYSEYKY